MKRILLLIFLSCGLIAQSQPFNNEWIDYSKTYYKFKVGSTGLYRISQASLASIGLSTTAAEHFQLWRNGKEIPLYTSVSTGILGAGDYLEFWGEKNDGKPDKELYKHPGFQMSDKSSLQTDTAAFFLTVNSSGVNLRLVNTLNNIAGNVLSPEPYFMYLEGFYCGSYINGGNYVNAGEYVYSSSYDKGEGWVCGDIHAGQSFTNAHPLFLNSSGPAATFKINLFGNAINPRTFRIKINGDSIYGQQLDYLNFDTITVPGIPLSLLSSGTANIEITNKSTVPTDRMVFAKYELIYPRVFNFGASSNFEFELPANASGNYLEISNFNYGSVAPVLYDLTNGKRYVADISDPSLVKVVLEPSSADRKLVMVSEAPTNIKQVSTFITRNFFNPNTASNHGDYLIITHPVLFDGPGGTNPVEEYRSYRNSVAGGGYNAKIFVIDELVDQFAFGIKKHPASIRNFLRWARANFTMTPKFVFLIGHAVVYDQYRYYESSPDLDKLNLVPTFGTPASDILLSADPGQQIPLIPIGRLSVINGSEITTYLSKVQQYEATQKFSSPLIQDKAWMKNVIHVIGGNDPVFGAQVTPYFNKFRNIISDTLFGGRVTTFTKSSPNIVEPLTDQYLATLMNEGISQLTYLGHSSSTVLDFNIENPAQYNNQGKYPIFIVMGCNAGNFFNYNPARFFVKETLSEKFVLANERGSIAFIASSHFGIPHYLDIYNTKTYTAESRTHYGKTIGEIMKESIIQTFNQTSVNDFFSRFHTEQTTLHGDPALKPNTHARPDYVIEDPLLKISPSFISIADTIFKVDAKFLNIGKAINQEVAILVERQFPDGSKIPVLKDTIPYIRYADSISITLSINPLTDKGLNRIIVTIDVDNVVDELYETNNSVTKDIFIFEDEARPVYPLNFAIINKQNITLAASTANPFSPSKQYKMEMDTTELYNSPFKVTKTISSAGGLLEFTPGVVFTDNTVYYWRVSPLDSSGNPSKWSGASFVYLQNSELGFNQSHFFQHTKSLSQRIQIDSVTRTWNYIPVINNLFIRSGIFPTASNAGFDYYIAVNGDPYIAAGCSYDEIIIEVFDAKTFQPWKNQPGGGLYGSTPLCGGSERIHNFLYKLNDTSGRRKARNFLENIVPDGAYVVIRSNTSPNDYDNTYVNVWQSDTVNLGSGNSLYHSLKNQGFSNLDLYDTTRCFMFAYKKNEQSKFTPQMRFSDGIYDLLTMNVNCPTPDTLGYISSPVFGPAKQWKQLKWNGVNPDSTPGDAPTLDVIGVN